MAQPPIQQQPVVEDLPPVPEERVQATTSGAAVETPMVEAQSREPAPTIEAQVEVSHNPPPPAVEQVFTPPPAAPQMDEGRKQLPRDILMAKARAYKEQTAHQARQATPEQLSMEVEKEELEESVDMPLNQNDLEVPTYLRRQQTKQDEMDG